MKSLKKMIFLVFFLTILVMIPGQILCSEEVTIVSLEARSGPFKEPGDRTVAVFQFLIDEINASGGLHGKKIRYQIEDSQIKPDIAVRKASKAIMEDNAQFIFAHSTSAVARALMDVGEKYKRIVVTTGAEADFLTGKDFNRYFFRTCFTTGNRSRAFAEFFRDKPWRKFFLINQDYAFGHAVTEDFKKIMKREIPDFKIVGEEYHPLATKDFGPYISKIISSGAEIVYTGNWGTDLEVLVKQGAQMGLKARYAAYFIDDPVVLANTGQAAVGSFVNAAYLPTVETPQNKSFLGRFNNKFKEAKYPWPAFHVGFAANGISFFFEAIKKAGSLDTETIIKTWEGMEYEGLMGKNIMRACDHQNLMPSPIAQIEAKSKFFPFPFAGTPLVVLPAEKIAVPTKETENARCQ